MFTPIEILAVRQDGNDGIIVKFSDGTSAGFVVEELIELRPNRFPTEPLETDYPEPTPLQPV
jgi:hypothetical protein